MIREGSGAPLVLFHGVLGSERMWRRVVPLVARHHDTIAPTALGHHGGRAPGVRPATFTHVLDDAERTLDELKIDKAHLAGNSLGGWVALELARRRRALSVCAFSPAGFWSLQAGGKRPAAERLRATMRDARRGRPLLPWLARAAAFRRWAMRLNALHGDRLSARDLVDAADDLLACSVGEDLLCTNEALAWLSPAPCRVTLAWSAHDRVFPVGINGERARSMMPDARFLVLDDVGHVPMFDAPDRVAATILETTGAASA
jgi:pimeloyl-ACP methyl ester carboxylesterase